MQNKNEYKLINYSYSFLFWKRFFLSFVILYFLTAIINNLYYIFEIIKLDLGIDTIFETLFDFSIFADYKSLFMYFIILILNSINISLFMKFYTDQKSIFKDQKSISAIDQKSISAIDQNNLSQIKNYHTKKYSNLFESLKSFLFVILNILLTGCFSCGVVLFGGFVSFGASTFLSNYSLYLQFSVIIILIINIYNLVKKINKPFIC